ncbi:sensor histidine kinase [Ruicaihuangia caeni]|uniref:Sensor-like histidine kinase SenX3 n=1 Tax=Ruicaihuangia caeni TaxID=3042517 RepID=A0AAW6T8Q9_9MICO|nr:ATP-binding protein [Klugiella sp. YN-L-19]MDI2098743.1 ATP-binding protein [Klugiella sp. YN-L-19]
MSPALLVPLALLFGILVGAGFVMIVVASARQGRHAASVVNSVVPDGVDQVLDVLESVGVVVDASNTVIKASAGALALGLVSHQSLSNAEIVRMVDEVRRSGETQTRELEVPRGPFSQAHSSLRVRVARLGTRYVLVLAQDLTDAIRLEEVRRDFVANISHELKTPIGAVTVLADAIEAARDDPEQVSRFARRLGKESERLARITREIIDLSRLQAGEALAERVLIEVDHIVAVAIDQNQVAAESRGIRLISRGDAGAEVYGDEPALVMAVQNLISNAIQHSPDHSHVGIGVSLREDAVEIAVTDQGVGIPEEERERVFERFYRGDPARSRNTGGTGLGLSIVKHVAQNHGGEVKVWSQLGRGSTFTMRLPRAEAAPQIEIGERTA